MSRKRRTSSPEFLMDRLAKKHADLENQLEELSGHAYLTPQEARLEKRLKKEKLAAKDEMAKVRTQIA
ncbi:MAG: YdcH family protein [Deltaproteobacteria bacterium]|nr:YdcH family protein [Deltaproteobacteria bacterium]